MRAHRRAGADRMTLLTNLLDLAVWAGIIGIIVREAVRS